MLTSALCCLLFVPGLGAAAAHPDEYTLKLVYLYNFTKFINWPAPQSNATPQPFNICIVGQLPNPEPLKKLETKRSKNRPIATKRLSVNNDSSACHILFITQSVTVSDTKKILARDHEHTIVVGETQGFAKNRGDIGFIIDDDQHVRVEINLMNTRHKQFTIRAPLLEIARKVYRKEERS